jgi:hypothetical protein
MSEMADAGCVRGGAAYPAGMRKYQTGRRLLIELCAARLVGIVDICGDGRAQHLVAIRREFCEIASMHGIGSIIIGRVLRCDSSTVRYHRSPAVRANRLATVRKRKARKL